MMEHWQWFVLGLALLFVIAVINIVRIASERMCRHKWEPVNDRFPVHMVDGHGDRVVGYKQQVRCTVCGAMNTFDVG